MKKLIVLGYNQHSVWVFENSFEITHSDFTVLGSIEAIETNELISLEPVSEEDIPEMPTVGAIGYCDSDSKNYKVLKIMP